MLSFRLDGIACAEAKSLNKVQNSRRMYRVTGFADSIKFAYTFDPYKLVFYKVKSLR